MSLKPQQYFSDLVAKLIDGSITKSELDKLLYFFLNNQEIKNWPDHLGSKEDIQERIHEKIRLELNFAKNEEVKVIPFYQKPFFKYAVAVAASVAVLITFTAVFNQQNQDAVAKVVPNKIEIGTDKAMLTLEDGTDVVLEKGKTYNNKNVNSTGKELLYNKSNSSSNKVVYNYLTIPRGGQFSLTLSDGTKVWLNSETKLKFPVNFIEGKTRGVELVYGEAYFDVSPSTAHNGAGFTVFQKKQQIHVLGTQFNIKAYKDDAVISTTLVEGKVAINYNGKTQNITPNEQSNFNLVTNTLTVKTVDVINEISWKNGIFSFENKPLNEMMKVLSRWYDIDVVFKDKSIENKEFVGVLRKNQKIEEILTSIQNLGAIKSFKIKDNTVVLE
jgi:hypothetical protein